MADLPNCPLCGSALRADPDDYTAGWLCSDEDCPLPTCSLAALRALAALRKPRRDQRIRDVRPWRIEVWKQQDGEWVARTRRMSGENVGSQFPPFSLHVDGVGFGATREEALRRCIKDHKGRGWRVNWRMKP